MNSLILLFADDFKLYRVMMNNDDTVLLQNDLNALVFWCKNNGLQLNVSKCTFSRKLISSIRYYSINDELLLTLFFFWFSSFVNCISLFLKTISYLLHFDI
jgi:hypothetical protein